VITHYWGKNKVPTIGLKKIGIWIPSDADSSGTGELEKVVAPGEGGVPDAGSSVTGVDSVSTKQEK